MSDTWQPGDKVVLTGSGWRAGLEGLKHGDVVTLEKQGWFTSEWFIKERPSLYVTDSPVATWGGRKVDEDAMSEPEVNSGEVRTTSDSGGQKGVKPEAYALIPWEAMDEVARVYNAGAQKYAAHNWRLGYEWSKSFAAACRHLFAFWRGEDRDPETGTLHLANATFHLLGMITFALDRERYGKYDDRYNPPAADSDS
jgi:hypothetical protein